MKICILIWNSHQFLLFSSNTVIIAHSDIFHLMPQIHNSEIFVMTKKEEKKSFPSLMWSRVVEKIKHQYLWGIHDFPVILWAAFLSITDVKFLKGPCGMYYAHYCSKRISRSMKLVYYYPTNKCRDGNYSQIYLLSKFLLFSSCFPLLIASTFLPMNKLIFPKTQSTFLFNQLEKLLLIL